MRDEKVLGMFGPADHFSMGLSVVMADAQLKRAMAEHRVHITEMGNAKSVITDEATGKWYVVVGGWGNDRVPTMLLGAVCGDMAGSPYDRLNIKYRPDEDTLVMGDEHFTDDTVMTLAVAEGIRLGLSRLPLDWMDAPEAEAVLFCAIRDAMRRYGRDYPHAEYGGLFQNWLRDPDPQPYNSWGNGSAMRVSYAGWVARSLEEAEKLAEISAKVTHDHPDGIKGAVVIAGIIFQLRNGASKDDIFYYASRFYDVDFCLEDIQDEYYFDASCMGSVPHAIVAFLEGESFTDVISGALSIGGDSDTIAAMAGSMAEVIYPIPQALRGRVIDRLDSFLKDTIIEAVDFAYTRLPE